MDGPSGKDRPMFSRRCRYLIPGALLLMLGGCVAYDPGYGYGYGAGGYYAPPPAYVAPRPVYVAPALRHHGGGGWWGRSNHHRHYRNRW